jgi:hypothetical protein
MLLKSSLQRKFDEDDGELDELSALFSALTESEDIQII